MLGLRCFTGFSLVAVSRGCSLLLWDAGFSLEWLLLLWSTGSRTGRLQQLRHMGPEVVARGLENTGSIVVAHRLSCSVAFGVFLDQGSNLYLLHWQVDSLPCSHQGTPSFLLKAE